MQPDIDGLKTIAVVTAAKPSYGVDLAGVESIEGHQTYHLRLRPLREPSKHNLRDVWVDTVTSDLWRAHFLGTYDDSAADVTTDLAPANGYWIESHATWTFEGTGGSYAFDSQIAEMVFVNTLPDWLFDSAEYANHVRAGEPDYLKPVLDQASVPENTLQATPVPAPTP